MSQLVEVYDHEFLHLYMCFVAPCSCMLPDDEPPINLPYINVPVSFVQESMHMKFRWLGSLGGYLPIMPINLLASLPISPTNLPKGGFKVRAYLL